MRRALFCLLLSVGTVQVAGGLPSASPRPGRADVASGQPDQSGILVSAALSLTDALWEVAKAYVAAGGRPVRFNFGASNVLARQIANGAPADVFISADEVQMDYVQKAGAIDPATRVALLGNRLAIVVPSGRPLGGSDARALADARIRRVAIGDPAAVPAGVYAKQHLERVGLWNALQAKLLPLANVRAALAAVESGGADAAIVYESDVVSGKRVDLAFVIEGPDAPRIVYPAAIVVRSKNRGEAQSFLAFLRGSAAAAIFRRFKFRVPPDQRTKGPKDLRTYSAADLRTDRRTDQRTY